MRLSMGRSFLVYEERVYSVDTTVKGVIFNMMHLQGSDSYWLGPVEIKLSHPDFKTLVII